jgi:preprotein translocase subunit SecA
MGKNDIPILGPIINRLIGTRNERFVKRYNQRASEINALEPQMRVLTDAALRAKFKDLRTKVDQGAKADEVMGEAFAVAREAMDRAVGIRNVFNPERNFDISLLSPEGQAMYREIQTNISALPVIIPRTIDRDKLEGQVPAAVLDEKDEWLGHSDFIPAWRYVEIPPAFYEEVRKAFPESRPPYRARPFDVQLIGGMVLCQGKISEMKTGEGKTIVAPLACYRAAIERMRVHVVTVNDYLVQRDRDWTAPYFHALGLTVGAIHPQHMQSEDIKRGMYMCDVVYGTTAEFGFDYLRDNMKRTAGEQVQRSRDFAIVDEVDSILIDEARTPLIISGEAHPEQPRYEMADKLARHLVMKNKPWFDADKKLEDTTLRAKGLEGDIRQTRDKSQVPALEAQLKEARAQLPTLKAARDKHTQYFEVKLDRKQCHVTHDGISEAQRVAGVGSFYVDENIDLPHLLEQSLRAHTVYELDKDYIVRELPDQRTGRPTPSVVIVDQNTGRAMIGRQWSDGLHQAIECKERVPIKAETQTVATITIQNFFKMYKRLAGMTGTADTEAQEFHDIYNLDVVAIPTNKQVRRRDFDDVVYINQKDKWKAIVDEIKAFSDVGRPVLVGTTSVEKSETLSKLLTQTHQIPHEVLNAKQHEREAHIVEDAGQLGAVMIATNMAGRGTDIKLGKVSREQQLDYLLRRNLAPATLKTDMSNEQLRELVYRKIAHRELGGVNKRDVESIPFAELELQLLRAWAARVTYLDRKSLDRATAAELREELDRSGRFQLHNLRWYESVEEMGGLHVVGTERHESRRIDNQLRGRSGRQGDRGSSRYFISLEDDLMRMFSMDGTQKVLSRLGMKEGDAIEHPMLSKLIENNQRKVEERYFQYRKQILEYDEVMEHQRQFFYGTRQRVLEGNDVRGLVMEFIRTNVDKAVSKYLDADYSYERMAEFANQKLECSIDVSRLRGRELDEIEREIRAEAMYDARQAIELTLGEYLPDAQSEAAVDLDVAGLVNWARNRFGVEIDPSSISSGSVEERTRVRSMLVERTEDVIRAADLSALKELADPNLGARDMSEWVKRSLRFEIAPDEIAKVAKTAVEGKGKVASSVPVVRGTAEKTLIRDHPVSQLVMTKVKEWYDKREVDVPVEFGLANFQGQSRQDPRAAAANFLAWANSRFAMGWTSDLFRTSSPQAAGTALREASAKYHAENRMQQEIKDALACKTDEELTEFFKAKFGAALPDSMKFMKPDERDRLIRARVETLRRPELLYVEQRVILDVMDVAWKDHLHAVEQLRETIGFRSFSQNDPRIEFKREASQMFSTVMDTVREQIVERIFSVQLGTPRTPPPGAVLGGAAPAPRPLPPTQHPGQQPPQQPQPRPSNINVSLGSGITGPGL